MITANITTQTEHKKQTTKAFEPWKPQVILHHKTVLILRRNLLKVLAFI